MTNLQYSQERFLLEKSGRDTVMASSWIITKNESDEALKKRLARAIKYMSDKSFDSIIMFLISKAQGTYFNRMRLLVGFPEYVEMWEEWQNTYEEEDFFKKYNA